MSRSRRWIAQEIERLDPEVDYEAIWRLTSTYGLDDFAVNLATLLERGETRPPGEEIGTSLVPRDPSVRAPSIDTSRNYKG